METILVLSDDPALAIQVKDSVGDRMRVAHAASLPADAAAFAGQRVAIVVSDSRVNSQDAVPVLVALKLRYPAIVNVVCSEIDGDQTLTDPLSQGHIYRLIPKPVKTGVLRQTLQAAAGKRRELVSNPFLMTGSE